mmetsp:Transcript_24754/g.38176  ORF Transcript_24754/g.38176 Transcript_24754/m.38176 type:complete len:103 (+) Transcript_24754:1776-2084(+)
MQNWSKIFWNTLTITDPLHHHAPDAAPHRPRGHDPFLNPSRNDPNRPTDKVDRAAVRGVYPRAAAVRVAAVVERAVERAVETKLAADVNWFRHVCIFVVVVC